MTQKEFLNFLQELYSYSTTEERLKFTETFYKTMFTKYNNQFDSNGYIDELIEVLQNLKNNHIL